MRTNHAFTGRAAPEFFRRTRVATSDSASKLNPSACSLLLECRRASSAHRGSVGKICLPSCRWNEACVDLHQLRAKNFLIESISLIFQCLKPMQTAGCYSYHDLVALRFCFFAQFICSENFCKKSSLVCALRLLVGERVAAAAGPNKKILVMAKTQIPATRMP